ncbi:MAG: LysR family hydrogen peroxide-inducible transcriptional activator [Bradymonadia bacterium]|jgi:LysR family hydrogen peroxide-inducible transcriptional activator
MAVFWRPPLGTGNLLEYPLCDEDFLIFHTTDAVLDVDADDRVQVADLPTEQLIVMREGHCLRTQTLDLCALGDAASEAHRFHIEAGSVATLCAMVRGGPFFTILPALAAEEMRQQGYGALIKEITGDVPLRQVSLVVRRPETRRAVREALFEAAHAALRPLTASTRMRQTAPRSPL